MTVWDMLHRLVRSCHYAIWLPSLKGFIGYTQIGPCSYIREYTFQSGNGVKTIAASVYTINPEISRQIKAVYGGIT